MSSSQSKDIRNERQVIEHHYFGCCWPNGGQRGRLFWGAALIVLGGVWLAGNLFGLDDWGRWLFPILFTAWGAGLLLERASGSSN